MQYILDANTAGFGPLTAQIIERYFKVAHCEGIAYLRSHHSFYNNSGVSFMSYAIVGEPPSEKRGKI